MEEKEVGCATSALTPPGNVFGLGGSIGVSKSSLTKQRYVELVQLGKIASEQLTKHGLLRHEYCEFGRIMEKIMQLE